MYRFLLKPNWLLLHLGALLLAALFIGLGFWQLRRLETRQNLNVLLQERLILEPQPLDRLLQAYRTDTDPGEDSSIAYRPTTVTGRYDPTEEVLLRSAEAVNGEPGYFVLTPLVFADQSAVLVERGWVPFDMNTPPVEAAAPPEEAVEVRGIVTLERKPPTGWGASLAPRDPPGDLTITAYPDSKRLGAQMPYTLPPLYIELQTQQPPQTSELPLPKPSPEFGDGPHLGYAVQWFAFALIGTVGYGFLMRQTARQRTKN